MHIYRDLLAERAIEFAMQASNKGDAESALYTLP